MSKRYKNFLVKYDGSYLSGCAVVRATCKDNALELVENHPVTCNFKDVEVTEIKAVRGSGQVLYNDNGDY